MEAGEPSISTNMSEDENEEETSTGEEEPLNGTYYDPFLQDVITLRCLHSVSL